MKGKTMQPLTVFVVGSNGVGSIFSNVLKLDFDASSGDVDLVFGDGTTTKVKAARSVTASH